MCMRAFLLLVSRVAARVWLARIRADDCGLCCDGQSFCKTLEPGAAPAACPIDMLRSTAVLRSSWPRLQSSPPPFDPSTRPTDGGNGMDGMGMGHAKHSQAACACLASAVGWQGEQNIALPAHI